MADADQATDEGWLLLVYRVPSEPSRLRAAVWRRLKSLGAIYLPNSAAALLSCSVLASEPDVRAAFQAARDDEYEEIVDKCEDFLGQVKKEYAADHFTYAELEENEVDLVKLRNWFARVRQRDVFGAAGRPAAEKALETCQQALDDYAARVYAEEAEGD